MKTQKEYTFENNTVEKKTYSNIMVALQLAYTQIYQEGIISKPIEINIEGKDKEPEENQQVNFI